MPIKQPSWNGRMTKHAELLLCLLDSDQGPCSSFTSNVAAIYQSLHLFTATLPAIYPSIHPSGPLPPSHTHTRTQHLLVDSPWRCYESVHHLHFLWTQTFLNPGTAQLLSGWLKTQCFWMHCSAMIHSWFLAGWFIVDSWLHAGLVF